MEAVDGVDGNAVERSDLRGTDGRAEHANDRPAAADPVNRTDPPANRRSARLSFVGKSVGKYCMLTHYSLLGTEESPLNWEDLQKTGGP